MDEADGELLFYLGCWTGVWFGLWPAAWAGARKLSDRSALVSFRALWFYFREPGHVTKEFIALRFRPCVPVKNLKELKTFKAQVGEHCAAGGGGGFLDALNDRCLGILLNAAELCVLRECRAKAQSNRVHFSGEGLCRRQQAPMNNGVGRVAEAGNSSIVESGIHGDAATNDRFDELVFGTVAVEDGGFANFCLYGYSVERELGGAVAPYNVCGSVEDLIRCDESLASHL